MAVSAQLLVEELQIFGLECEEAVIEKCEFLAPSLDPSPGPPPPTPPPAQFRVSPP